MIKNWEAKLALAISLVLTFSAVSMAQSGAEHQHSMPTQSTQPSAGPTPANAVPTQSEKAVLTLTDLEQMALASNPTLRQAAAQIRAAQGRKQQAGLYPNPTVGYDSDEVSGGPIRGGQQGFFISQNIVLGGKLGLSRRVFEQERLQSEEEANEQKYRVLNNVRLGFVQVLAAQRTVELRQQLSKLAQDAVVTSKQLFNVGQADAPDVLQGEVESEQEDLELITAQQNYARAWQELAATVGRPDLPPTRLAGNLEELPEINPDQWLQTILRDSPAVKIAELGVKRAEAQLARARREPVPDLQLRGGLRDNRELLDPTGRPIGLQGFAEVGVQLPIFNRNQGNVAAARADLERAQNEVQRVQLLLRRRAAPLFQSYLTARMAVDRYKKQMLPRAQQAYQLYLKKYQSMAAAYPQVLVAQRTLFQLQTDYISALQNAWMNAVAIRGFLLTDGLEPPAAPGELERTVREINLPSTSATSLPER